MTVWAYELCFCEHETGYQVKSLHTTKELATEAMDKDVKSFIANIYDGWRVREWEVSGNKD